MKLRRIILLFFCSALWGAVGYAGQDVKQQFGELSALADTYGTDKGPGHHYTEVYEYFFTPLKHEAKKILEIGVSEGASLRMWRDFFPGAITYGIDILDRSSMNCDKIKTFVADQSDREGLQSFIDTFGGDFDVILDDGGHTMEQQQVSFGFFFKYVRPGGYYVIEDVHTSIYALYGNEYGAAANGKDTTLAMIDHYIRTGIFKSPYLDAVELNYLTTQVEYCSLFSRDKGRSVTCIFKKRNKPTP